MTFANPKSAILTMPSCRSIFYKFYGINDNYLTYGLTSLCTTFFILMYLKPSAIYLKYCKTSSSERL